MMIDTDVMASMLPVSMRTVIMSFVRSSFIEGSNQLRRLELGETIVVIEQAKRLILVVTFAGAEPTNLRLRMREFAEQAEQRFGGILDGWNGDMTGLSDLVGMARETFFLSAEEDIYNRTCAAAPPTVPRCDRGEADVIQGELLDHSTVG